MAAKLTALVLLPAWCLKGGYELLTVCQDDTSTLIQGVPVVLGAGPTLPYRLGSALPFLSRRGVRRGLVMVEKH